MLVWDGFALGRRALRHRLEGWGLLVEEAETLQHLLQRAREQPTTVVIGLGAQGLALPEVKAQFQTLRAEGCDIIALINSIDETLHEQIRSAGASACLPKLLSRRELKARLCQALIPDDAAHHPDGSRDHAAGPLGGYHLLVADDNRINLRLLATLLRRQGAEVDEASDGQGAVEAFAQRAYDAVLLDVHMPVMSGLDAVRAMRRLELPGQRTTVLAVTANAVPEDWAAFRAAGMDDCLVKPVDESQLLDRLARYGIGGRMALDKPPDDDSPLQDVGLQSMLQSDLADQQRELIAAARSGDRSTLQSLAHKIHGSAAFCRLPALKAAAAALENELREGGQNDHMHTLVQRLSDAMAQTLDTLGSPHAAAHSSSA